VGYITVANSESLHNIFAEAKWATATWALSLSIQVTATTLIVWKIWNSTSWSYIRSRTDSFYVIWILVESGALLTACYITLMVLFLLKTNAGSIMTNIIAQVSVSIIIAQILSLADLMTL
jgi:hypothetical protein